MAFFQPVCSRLDTLSKAAGQLILATVVLFAIAGCGYSIHPQSSLPATEVHIAPVENRTREPKLQDKLHRALTEEFAKQGVRVNPAAEFTLAVSVTKFDMISMSEKESITVDYRVAVNADFRLIDRSGKVIETRTVSSPFFVTVTAVPNLGTLFALRDVAEEQAMRDIAMEIVGALIFR